MATLLQVNISLNYGSTGRIAEGIGNVAACNGWKVYIAHGNRYRNQTKMQSIKIGSLCDEYIHYGWNSLLWDRHGLGSRRATKKFIEQIYSDIKPDIIHLHNIHGYYLNYKLLFEYIKKANIQVVWTLHDCWSFTGHCGYFDLLGCDKWKTGCRECQQTNTYPKSLFIDNSIRNYQLKKKLFTSFSNRLTLVPVSEWLAGLVQQSFLGGSRIQVIHNGIDISSFAPCDAQDMIARYNLEQRKIILGVASPWTERKGLSDFIKLRDMLPLSDYAIVLVGLNKNQIANLPHGIIGIERTQSIQELAQWYTAATILFNPTYEDNYPTVNLEAISCGTPVVTYWTGGCPETVSHDTGFVVNQGDLKSAVDVIHRFGNSDRSGMRLQCRSFAKKHFDENNCFRQYIDLYNHL